MTGLTRTAIDSPVGRLTLAARDGMLCGLYFQDHVRAPDPEALGVVDDRAFGATVEQLDAYFRGELTRFDIPMHLGGTPFRRSVWRALDDIVYGHTETYAQLATRLGRPSAARAVGAANAANPVSIIVPCHRLVGAGGDLTGYAGGLDRKRALLALERSHQIIDAGMAAR